MTIAEYCSGSPACSTMIWSTGACRGFRQELLNRTASVVIVTNSTEAIVYFTGGTISGFYHLRVGWVRSRRRSPRSGRLDKFEKVKEPGCVSLVAVGN